MSATVNVLPNLNSGDLLQNAFDDVHATITTALNGNILKGVQVGTAIGGTDLPVGLHTTIGGAERPLEVQVGTTIGGGERPVGLRGDLNATANTSSQLTTDLLDKIAARLATTVDGTLLDKMNATVGLTASIKELAPLILTLLWTEIPIVKLRFPHHYTFGFCFFGFEFFSFRFRGETKAVTAKNPNGAAGNVDV